VKNRYKNRLRNLQPKWKRATTTLRAAASHNHRCRTKDRPRGNPARLETRVIPRNRQIRHCAKGCTSRYPGTRIENRRPFSAFSGIGCIHLSGANRVSEIRRAAVPRLRFGISNGMHRAFSIPLRWTRPLLADLATSLGDGPCLAIPFAS